MNILRFSDIIARGDAKNKRVFIRADLNIPLNEAGDITEDTRIKATLPSIQMALDAGAAVMVTSHLGRPEPGTVDPRDTLLPVAKRMSELMGRPVKLIQNWVSGVDVKPGEVVLLENCRCNIGEKKNDDALSREMAKLADIYVNDAFGTAHRKEATLYGMAQYVPIACAGPLLWAEVENISKVISNPKQPLIAIVAGSKVSTKLTVLNNLADKVDGLIVGGGIANTFMLANGLPIGKSLAESDLVEEAKTIMQKMAARGAQVPIPVDVVVAREFKADATATIKNAQDVGVDDMILDIGPQTAKTLADIIAKAGTVVWNGPVGVFEFDAFSQGTKVLAEAIAKTPAFTLAGGGDTLAAIAKFGIGDQVGYISTGGGAFLEMLEGKKLPALEILEKRAIAQKANHV